MATSHAAGPDRIYMIDGFLFRSPISATRASFIYAQEQMEGFLKEKHPKAIMKDLHNNNWYKICEEIKNLPVNERPRKLVLIGHSFGGWAGVQVSLCLKDIQKVDLLITIDSVHKVALDDNADKFHETKDIPRNVTENMNFYQESDLILRGEKANQAVASECTTVSNELVKIGLAFSPHNKIVQILAESNKLISNVDRVLKKESPTAITPEKELIKDLEK